MKSKFAVAVILLCAVFSLRADDSIAGAQRALKDQGFYYGEVTGQKDADTTAAIRRFQIRNGLQVTGELNEETTRALAADNSARPAATVTPMPAQKPERETKEGAGNELREAPDGSPPTEQVPVEPAPRAPAGSVRPEQPVEAAAGGLFDGTPYATAPPDVQRNIIVSAQNALMRVGLYRDAIDGVFGPNMEFSLRAYQSRVGLRTTGRLDLRTLAALELLPGARAPIYTPRRRVWREEPVRGQWIPEH